MNLATMIMEDYREYRLKFEGYYSVDDNNIPEIAGIYCIYSWNANSESLKLLYIGQSVNIKERLNGHEHYTDWKKHTGRGRSLLFSYVAVAGDEDRYRIEAALIFKHKPICNTQNADSFGYGTTRIVTDGKKACLWSDFTVRQNERSE